jgi:hypothetical protein
LAGCLLAGQLCIKVNARMALTAKSFHYIFWERPGIEALSPEDFTDYLRRLRDEGRGAELLEIVRRHVERGNSVDAWMFPPDEILDAIKQIRRSSRAAGFVDSLGYSPFRVLPASSEIK